MNALPSPGPPAPVEALFGLIVRAEAAILGLGLRLPFGGSVLATAVKL